MYAGASFASKALSRLHERLALIEISVRGRQQHELLSRLLKKTHMLRCAQSPRYNVLAKYASARRFFARLASESF
jgi:hypothetical protein